MLLELTTTHRPATDLGFLLHKNPARAERFDLAFGPVHVFYPEASAERCSTSPLSFVAMGGRGLVQPAVKVGRIEGLERFVRSEPLWRVHECVFGVLALESEPVDPRL